MDAHYPKRTPGINGASSYLKGIYDNMSPCGARKNKPNQTQFARAECCVMRSAYKAA
jgi:hypothetical protein